MSELEEQPQPAPLVLKRGSFYDSKGPGGEDIVVMSKETWIDYNTGVESIKQALAQQTRLLQDRTSEYEVAMRRLTDVSTRLDNLRAVRRGELRADIENQINIPSQG